MALSASARKATRKARSAGLLLTALGYAAFGVFLMWR